MAVIPDRICVQAESESATICSPVFKSWKNVVWERGILSLNESSLHRRDYSVIRQQHLSLILVGMEAESTGSPHLVQQQGASSRRRGNRYLCTPPAWVLCFCPAPDVGSGAQEKKSWICNHRMMHKTRHQTDKIISLNITPFLQNKSQVFTFYNYTT